MAYATGQPVVSFALDGREVFGRGGIKKKVFFYPLQIALFRYTLLNLFMGDTINEERGLV